MRRRPPRLIQLSQEDTALLEELAHDGRTEQRVARRARILLAMADPDTVVQDLAEPARRSGAVDGGSSHIAQETRDLLRRYRHVRVLVTPPHASWLNQAELLLRAFSARYLPRGDWKRRSDFIAHLDASWPEYNRLYAPPFTWLWTRAKMHDWFERHRH